MAGNNSTVGLETITFTDNMSFDGTERGGAMTTDGQLWIGSTAPRHVQLGSVTSPDNSLTIGYNAPNITAIVNPSPPTRGSLVLISAQTAISSASIEFTGLTGYDVYQLVMYGVTTAGGNGNINMQFSSDNGSNWVAASYSFAGRVQSAGGASSGAFVSVSTSEILLINGVSDSATFPFSVNIQLYDFNSSSLNKVMYYTSQGNFDSGYLIESMAVLANTTSMNAIKVYPGAGNFSIGEFKLYGMVN
jgi:hypothetical protein